jgi:predicted nicotinamide N-methyase
MPLLPPDDWVEEVLAFDGLDVIIHRPPDPFAEGLIDMDVYDAHGELPYWAELWPSAIALARRLRSLQLGGQRVLELGCGLALPSVVAALQGARVLATDLQPDALAAAAHNAEANDVELELMTLDWRELDEIAERLPFDLVLCADVLYETHQVDSLLDVLTELRSPVLLADQGRAPGASFFTRAPEHFSVTSRRDAELPHVTVHALRPRDQDVVAGGGAAQQLDD